MTHTSATNGCEEPDANAPQGPRYEVDGFTLADGTVSVVGFVLAPDGDPGKVHIEADPSVRIRWHSAETAAMRF